VKRLSARARKVRNKIISNDSRCIPIGTIMRTENVVVWLCSGEHNALTGKAFMKTDMNWYSMR
jgi:L-rhamnose isomerase